MKKLILLTFLFVNPGFTYGQTGRIIREAITAVRPAKIIRKSTDDVLETAPAVARQGVKTSITLTAENTDSSWFTPVLQAGDSVSDWLWAHKGSVAVGTAATAVVLEPDAFFHAAEDVTSNALDAATSQIVKPLIKESAENIAKPLASGVARSSWFFPILLFTLAVLFVLLRIRKQIA